MFSISFPWLPVIIPIILVIWYFGFRERIGVIPPNPVIAKYTKNMTKRQHLLWIIRAGIICGLILWLSGITYTYESSHTEPEKNNIILIVDISRSMLAEDIPPNRMEIAKKYLKHFILSRKSDAFGMIIFAGKPFLVVADSDDSEGMIEYIDHMGPSQILQERAGLSGTNIGDAILLALDTLTPYTGKKSIILFTDGSANIGFDPLQASQYAQDAWIQINTVGISAQNHEPIFYTDQQGNRNFFFDTNGEKISWEFDVDLLQKMANNTQGRYFDARNEAELQHMLVSLNAEWDAQKIYKTHTNHIDLSPWLYLISILFFVIEMRISKSLRRSMCVESVKKQGREDVAAV